MKRTDTITKIAMLTSCLSRHAGLYGGLCIARRAESAADSPAL
jgi:hypothetical protein